MAITLGAITERVRLILSDEGAPSDLGGTQIRSAIMGVVESRYSKDRPAKAVVDVQGDGGFAYATSDLSGYEEGFSEISEIFYPVNDSARTDNRVKKADWHLEDRPGGEYLIFKNVSPSASNTFRVVFPKPHRFASSSSTASIDGPLSDLPKIANLAASELFGRLAKRAVDSAEGTVEADRVDRLSKAAEYRALAKAYMSAYEGEIDPKEVKDTIPMLVKI